MVSASALYCNTCTLARLWRPKSGKSSCHLTTMDGCAKARLHQECGVFRRCWVEYLFWVLK